MIPKMIPKCRYQIQKKQNNKRWTTSKYVEELKRVDSTIECCEEYINARTPILHKCLVCGNLWNATPYHILKDTGCPSCGHKRGAQKNRITHEVFLKNLEGRLNPNVKIVGKYHNSHTKIECLCLLCGKVLWIAPMNLYWGVGCPSCSNKLNNPHKKQEQFCQELQSINPNVEIVGTYVGARDKIKCRCKICNFIWNGVPTNLLKGVGCPNCALMDRWEIRRPTKQTYQNKLRQRNPNLIVLGNYLNADTGISHQCSVCGYIWEISPHKALSGCGCPQCSSSYGEQCILAFLERQSIVYITQKRYQELVGIKGGQLSYDFYLPNYNLLIEFQGAQHEYPIEYFGGKEQFVIQQEHDRRKREYAEQHNIKLLEIWYYDYDRIEEILKENLNLESVETVIEA